MNKSLFVLMLVLLLVLSSIPVMAAPPIPFDELYPDPTDMAKGAHFNLNIIGVSKDKNVNMNNLDSGHVIFVDLGRKGNAANTKINLTEGDFKVIDKNGTDGTAEFQLPDPLEGGTKDATYYSVFIKVLGKPGGEASMELQAFDTDLGKMVYGGIVEVVRTEGKPKVYNVTRELLFVETDSGLKSLFDKDLINQLWDYNNQGLKLLQLRFFELPTDVTQ